jgi:hypothetical protein
MNVARRLLAVLTAGLAVAGLVVPGGFAEQVAAAEVIPGDPVPWCVDAPGSYPCIDAGTHDGTSVKTGIWQLQVVTFSIPGDPSKHLTFTAEHNGSADLGAADKAKTWSITLDMGTAFVPRVATGHGSHVTVTRSHPAHYRIQVTGHPVTVTGDCNQAVWPWNCPSPPPKQWDGYFDGQITDYAVWDDAAQRDAMYGMDYFTNLAATSVPPEITHDPATDMYQLLIRMANSHFLMDGHTVFEGRSELRIPNAFLQTAYGVPNPALMTGSGLIGTVSGSSATAGDVTIWQEAGNDAMRVLLDGVTFSARTFTVRRGTITPTRPTSVHPRRMTYHRGRVRFEASQPRGARVSAYRVRCDVAHGTHFVRATASGSPVVVKGLIQGRAYLCKVRALSKAGPSRWSVTVRMPRYVS